MSELKVSESERILLNQMFAAYQGLKKLGWNDAVYCPKDGSMLHFIEVGSTGIHLGNYQGKWPDGHWWIHEANDLWPSRPILFKKAVTVKEEPQP